MTQVISAAAIRQFLADDLGVDVQGHSDDAPLFSTGVIDSFALVSLLSFIEKAGNIRIGVGDVTLDNFDSVSRMVEFVARNGK